MIVTRLQSFLYSNQFKIHSILEKKLNNFQKGNERPHSKIFPQLVNSLSQQQVLKLLVFVTHRETQFFWKQDVVTQTLAICFQYQPKEKLVTDSQFEQIKHKNVHYRFILLICKNEKSCDSCISTQWYSIYIHLRKRRLKRLPVLFSKRFFSSFFL